MDSLILRSLFSYIKMHFEKSRSGSVVQFKIPAKAYRLSVIYDLLRKICNDPILNHDSEAKVYIAKQAEAFWNGSDNLSVVSLINNIRDNYSTWLDDKGNLTSYRNAVCESSCDKKMLLVLIGDDLIDDKASIAHFLDCGPDSLIKSVMKGSFKQWILSVAKYKSFDIDEKIDLKVSDAVLKYALRYSDLNLIDDFLCNIELDYNDSRYFSVSIGWQLYKIQLPSINLNSIVKYQSKDDKIALNSRKINGTISAAKSILDGNAQLESTKSMIKKIDTVKNNYSNDPDDKSLFFLQKDSLGYYPYSEPMAYLEACKNVVEGTFAPADKAVFLKSDSDILINKILKYKEKKEPSTSEKLLEGMPLQVILNACWLSVNQYYQSNMKDNAENNKIAEIKIVPTKFNHNISKIENSNNDTELEDYVITEYLKPYFNGLDKLIDDILIESSSDSESVFFGLKVQSLLSDCFVPQGIIIDYKATKIPALSFSICVIGVNDSSIVFDYKVQIPKGAPISYSRLLIKQQKKILENTGSDPFIPVFTLGKFTELFEKTDSEASEFFEELVSNFPSTISAENIYPKYTVDDVSDKLFSLDASYREYIHALCDNGVYAIISSDKAKDFYTSYNDLLKFLYSNKNLNNYSTLITKILKSFWIINKEHCDSEALSDMAFSAGCLTILHPAMIEMIRAQYIYLKDAFCSRLDYCMKNRLSENQINNTWDKLFDFSTVQAPIPCILDNTEIRTQVSGTDWLFKVGRPSVEDYERVPLSVTFTADVDFEEIPDSELTRMSDESNLIYVLIRDYFRSYASAYDGLRIAVFMPVNIQAVMAATIELVNKTIFNTVLAKYKEYPAVPFKLDLEFYADPEDEGRIGNWISKFNDYFAQKSLADSTFSHIDYSIGYRMIQTASNSIDNITSNLESDFSADIVLLYESQNASIWKGKTGLTTELDDVPGLDIDTTSIHVKFPMIEKLFPKKAIDQNPNGSKKRTKLISNRQFSTYSSYVNLMYCKKINKNIGGEESVVVVEEYDFKKWLAILDWCLPRCERVIALGSEIDKDLVMFCSNNANSNVTSLVGFGSGVGANANINYIVISQIFDRVKMTNKLAGVFNNLFNRLTFNECNEITAVLYRDSREMADLSLIRTLSCYEFYSHDFFGYSMIRHVLKPEGNPFCDILLSLDSYKHWFDDSVNFRADLLWLCAYIEKVNNKTVFKLKLTVIESKLATDVFDKFADKGCMQAIETRNILMRHFSTEATYDSRYWWMQLHRIIAANSTIIFDSDRSDVLQALENLAEGSFSSEWDTCVFAFEQSDKQSAMPVSIYNCRMMNANNEVVPLIEFTTEGIKHYMAKDFLEDFNYFKNSLPVGTEHDSTIDVAALKRALKADDEERFAMLSGDYKSTNYNDDEDIDGISIDLGNASSINMDGYSSSDIDNNALNDGSNENINDFTTTDTIRSDNSNEDLLITTDSNNGNRLSSVDEQYQKWNYDGSSTAAEKERTVVDSNFDIMIPIGKTRTNSDVYWAYGNNPAAGLNNRHMFILGASGSGKSYAIKAILGELARKKQASLIVDYTEGFTDDYFKDMSGYVYPQYDVKVGKKLPVNPFLKHKAINDSSYDVAGRISSVFHRIYPDIGDNQISVFNDVIEAGIDKYGNKYTMPQLLKDLEESARDPNCSDKKTRLTLAQKIKPFCKVDPFIIPADGEFAWEKVFYDLDRKDLITVFQLQHIIPDVQHAITDFVLWDLWFYMTSVKSTDKTPHTVVLDEIQNLDVNDDNTPVYKFLKEGRKFGLGVIAATQDIAGLKGVNSAGTAALMGAATFMFFKPPVNEMDAYAKLLTSLDSSRNKDGWKSMLATLGLGECIFFSNDNYNKNRARVIKITSLQDRGLAE